MAMNHQKAWDILTAKAPAYSVGKGTQKEYLLSEKNNAAWNKRIRENLSKYQKMGSFQPQNSAYYQTAFHRLKNIYRNQANQDLKNAVAAAAINTEGFGNSYGASAGNRAYQSAIAELSAKLPSLYTAAEGEFDRQKSDLAGLIELQQAQQNADLNAADFRLGAQQSLDEQRYASRVYADKRDRENARLWLQSTLR